MRFFIPGQLALPVAVGLGAGALVAALAVARPSIVQTPAGFDKVVSDNADRMMREGQQIFRFDSFGDEAFWVRRSSYTGPSPARRTVESAAG